VTAPAARTGRGFQPVEHPRHQRKRQERRPRRRRRLGQQRHRLGELRARLAAQMRQRRAEQVAALAHEHLARHHVMMAQQVGRQYICRRAAWRGSASIASTRPSAMPACAARRSTSGRLAPRTRARSA